MIATSWWGNIRDDPYTAGDQTSVSDRYQETRRAPGRDRIVVYRLRDGNRRGEGSRVGVGRREDGVLEADELEHGEAELLEVTRLERHDGRGGLHARGRARARRRGRARGSRRRAGRRRAARVRRRARARAVRRLVRRRRSGRRRGRGRGARRLLVRGGRGLRRHRRDGGRRAATEVPRAVDLARVSAAREEGEEAWGEVDRAERALHALAERAVSVAMHCGRKCRTKNVPRP